MTVIPEGVPSVVKDAASVVVMFERPCWSCLKSSLATATSSFKS